MNNDRLVMKITFNSIVDHHYFAHRVTSNNLRRISFNSIVDHHIITLLDLIETLYKVNFQFYSRSSEDPSQEAVSVFQIPSFNSIVDHPDTQCERE